VIFLGLLLRLLSKHIQRFSFIFEEVLENFGDYLFIILSCIVHFLNLISKYQIIFRILIYILCIAYFVILIFNTCYLIRFRWAIHSQIVTELFLLKNYREKIKLISNIFGSISRCRVLKINYIWTDSNKPLKLRLMTT